MRSSVAGVVYRGTFHYDHERQDVIFWHSGATHGDRGYVWSSAIQRIRLTDLLSLESRHDPRLDNLPPPPAELVDWP